MCVLCAALSCCIRVGGGGSSSGGLLDFVFSSLACLLAAVVA
jgi:hypothetical protein